MSRLQVVHKTAGKWKDPDSFQNFIGYLYPELGRHRINCNSKVFIAPNECVSRLWKKVNCKRCLKGK